MLFDVGRASGTCLPWSSVKRQHWYRGVPLQRQLVFPRPPEAVTTAKWRDVLEREQFSSQIVAISGDEAHYVSKW